MTAYLLWIPALIVLTAFWAWMSKQSNVNPSSLFFYVLFLAIPVWPFVTKYSKNLIFDGLLYDALMTIVYTATLIFLGTGQGFTPVQWCGVAVSIFGLILMKVV